jgi:hypothetical protein
MWPFDRKQAQDKCASLLILTSPQQYPKNILVINNGLHLHIICFQFEGIIVGSLRLSTFGYGFEPHQWQLRHLTSPKIR